jgi:CRP-like cAMP-binding protein
LVKNQLKIKQLIGINSNKTIWLNQFYDSGNLIFKSMKPILASHQLKKNLVKILEKVEFLKSVPIFSELKDDTLAQLSRSGSVQSFSKESIILSEKEAGSALFIIISGKVKISRISTEDDDKEVILSILNPSDFFGEMSLLDGLERSATCTAMEDSKILIIQRNDFLKLLEDHPEVSIALLQELTQRLRAAGMKIKALSLKDAEGKVASVILQLADDIGKIKHGVVEIEKLPFQHELANMAGTSRETISRTLHAFAKKGLIELEGSKLRIVDYEKFKELYGL